MGVGIDEAVGKPTSVMAKASLSVRAWPAAAPPAEPACADAEPDSAASESMPTSSSMVCCRRHRRSHATSARRCDWILVQFLLLPERTAIIEVMVNTSAYPLSNDVDLIQFGVVDSLLSQFVLSSPPSSTAFATSYETTSSHSPPLSPLRCSRTESSCL